MQRELFYCSISNKNNWQRCAEKRRFRRFGGDSRVPSSFGQLVGSWTRSLLAVAAILVILTPNLALTPAEAGSSEDAEQFAWRGVSDNFKTPAPVRSQSGKAGIDDGDSAGAAAHRSARRRSSLAAGRNLQIATPAALVGGPTSSLSPSDALLTYLRNQRNKQGQNRSHVEDNLAAESSSREQVAQSRTSSAAVQHVIDKLKANSHQNPGRHHQHIDFHMVTGPSAAAAASAGATNDDNGVNDALLASDYLNNQYPSAAAAAASMALSASAAGLAGPIPIRARQGFYGHSSMGGGGSKVFGTISPYTYDAALTAIAVTAFLTYALRVIVTAIRAGRRRKRSTDDGLFNDDRLFGEPEDEIDVLTKTVLPAVTRSWADMPPFAPEVAYLGFEMLWNYWKENGLKWTTQEEDERRICLSYRRLKGESRDNYERAKTTWQILSRVGISWTDPFLQAVERGIKGSSCAPSISSEMKVWG